MGKDAKLKAARRAFKQAPINAYYVPYDSMGNAWLGHRQFVRANEMQAWAQDKPYIGLAIGGFYIYPDLIPAGEEGLLDGTR